MNHQSRNYVHAVTNLSAPTNQSVASSAKLYITAVGSARLQTGRRGIRRIASNH